MSRVRLPVPRDPVVEAWKERVDRFAIRENLRMSPEERFRRTPAPPPKPGGMASRNGTTDYPALFRLLGKAQIEYILVGGAAAIAHGANRITEDFDVLYRRTRENHERIVRAIGALEPYMREAPPGLPFTLDRETLERGVDFVLTTSLGNFDLLGELTAGGLYEDLLPHSVEMELFGTRCWCLEIERLIHVKRAAGRWKDFEAIAELEVILEEKGD